MIVDFSKLSYIKIGPKIEVKELFEDNFEGETVIGRATNTLISPTPPHLAILSDKYKFINLKNTLHVGAKTQNRVLYSFCKRNDIKGFEFLAKLPGSIGGSIKMNAGVKEYEISNNLIAIKTKSGWIEKDKIDFSYRHSDINEPIFEALFEVKKGFDHKLDEHLKTLRANQPKEPSLGSVFKNPKGDYAGRLIEAVGMKGMKRGGIMVSPLHANFFVNIGGGKFEDMIYLINEAKKRVYGEFGIELEEEIIIL